MWPAVGVGQMWWQWVGCLTGCHCVLCLCLSSSSACLPACLPASFSSTNLSVCAVELLLPLMTTGHKAGHHCHFRVLHSIDSDTGRKKKKWKREKKKKKIGVYWEGDDTLRCQGFTASFIICVLSSSWARVQLFSLIIITVVFFHLQSSWRNRTQSWRKAVTKLSSFRVSWTCSFFYQKDHSEHYCQIGEENS